MCSILWWILYTWEALGCIFSNLCLDSCIGNKGEKKGGEKLQCIPRTYPKSPGGARAFLLHFWLLGGVVCCTKAVWPVLVTGLTGFGNRLDRFWEPAWPLCAQSWHLFKGGLHMCRGSSCIFWWFVLFAWAWFYSGCVEPLPLPKGSETCLQVILLFAFLSFRSLVGVYFYLLLCFFLFSNYQMCVLSMHS
jgi:hypothetical protein